MLIRPSSTAELRQKDRALAELLQEKVGLFAEMTHFQVEDDGGGVTLPTLPRGLFRSESLECPRGERLLQDAIREGEGAPPRDLTERGHTDKGRPHGSARWCPVREGGLVLAEVTSVSWVVVWWSPPVQGAPPDA